MKRFPIPTLTLTITLILSACGTKATPTAPAVDLQGTIAAAAFTVIAETQAAIPTATPLPPTATVTNTPLPTLTFIPLPPSGATLTPGPNGSSGGGDPCINKTLPNTLQGEPVRMRLNNSTKAKLSVTVYLNQTGPQGVCGYRSYTIDPQQFIVLNDLVEGCYTIWAWNPDQDSYFIVTNGTTCVDSSDSTVFDISTSSITRGT
jgi:uncharacterized protein YceK